MDLEKLLMKQENCLGDNPPSCFTQCPLHVDVKGIIGEIKKGNFEEAYRILKKRMPFTNIIALACDHPCENACVTGAYGKALSIHELEKAAVIYGSKAKIKSLPIPKNDKNVAIIGGGISGITCAADLNQKGYQVFIFEKGKALGGSLSNQPDIDSKLIQEETDRLEELGVEIKINQDITPELLTDIMEEYDAVFIGTGVWNEKYNYKETTLQTENEKVFVGGRIVTGCDSVIKSVSTGRCAAISIDRFVQKKSLTALREKEGTYQSKLKVDVDHGSVMLRILPENDHFTEEEAIREANRCAQCECHKCVKACIHLQKEKLDPKTYIRTINQNERIILGDHYANKTINSCMECGLCSSVCSSTIDMADIIKETRRSMVEKDKMPVSAHDFALKDMESSNSSNFELVKHQPGTDSSRYVFYPGCQLSASQPDYVRKVYDYLAERLEGGVGLYLGCCGAPADWAGREELYQQTIEKTRLNLICLGNPVIITACSTCYRNFADTMKEMKIRSLWEIIKENGLPDDTASGGGRTLMIHDACTTRHEKGIQESIREIAEQLDYKLVEPQYTRETTKCCGYGGLVYFANREFSREVTDDRIKDSDHDFLAYCANCRDLFLLRGKKTYHILDLIFGKDLSEISVNVPTLSQRRANRWGLKKNLMSSLWGEKMDQKEEYDNLSIIMDAGIRNKLEDELILEGDIKKIIGYAEDTKNSFFNSDNGHILAWRRLVNVTFWVEYEKVNEEYHVLNAYSHRMQITGV